MIADIDGYTKKLQTYKEMNVRVPDRHEGFGLGSVRVAR